MDQVIIVDPEDIYANQFRKILYEINPSLGFIVLKNARELVDRMKTSEQFLKELENSGLDPVKEMQKQAVPPKTTGPMTEAELKAFEESKKQVAKYTEKVKQTIRFGSVVLIISDLKSTREINLDLWKKCIAFINDKKSDEIKLKKPLRFILSGFDNQEFSDETVEQYYDVLFNFLYKPLDIVLVTQILKIAMQPNGPIGVHDLYKHKSKAVIEIIKNIKIELLTELGFRTKNTREIKINDLARYFGKPFQLADYDSVFAYCFSNTEISKDPPLYTSSFSYFGIPQKQLASIRRAIQLSKHTAMPFPDGKNTNEPISFLIFTKRLEFLEPFSKFLDSKFLNVKLHVLGGVQNLVEYLSPKQKSKFENYKPVNALPKDKRVRINCDESLKKIFFAGILSDKADPNKPEVNLSEVGMLFNQPIKEVYTKENLLKTFLKWSDFDKLLKINEVKDKTIIKFELPQGVTYLELFNVRRYKDVKYGNAVALEFFELQPKAAHAYVQTEFAQFSNVKFIIVDAKDYNPEKLNQVKTAQTELFPEAARPKLILQSETPITQYIQVNDVIGFDDIFHDPIDPFYASRKLKMHCPDLILKNKDDNSRLSIEVKEDIQTGILINILTCSEVHVAVIYPRDIKIGSIRRFRFLMKGETNVPDILGICRHTGPNPDTDDEDNPFLCEFLFFGVRDLQLKYIRRWIKDNYVSTKNPVADSKLKVLKVWK